TRTKGNGGWAGQHSLAGIESLLTPWFKLATEAGGTEQQPPPLARPTWAGWPASGGWRLAGPLRVRERETGAARAAAGARARAKARRGCL
ncbi:hypothetical protein BC831DRAFT_464968, partial [Entophlyctis helioformis]